MMSKVCGGGREAGGEGKVAEGIRISLISVCGKSADEFGFYVFYSV